ncbi:MAG: hypothetical protein J6B68_01870 [Lachnospiraceae bacterium]|nr:hypothetical protein [Lachnospiraceae bacterium]MBP3477595.1 hypothetical protein [Lachnospiraceae bacterium]
MDEKQVENAKVVEASETVQQEETIERPYKLRNLKDSDLFPMLNILKKIGIKDFKSAFIQVADGEKTIKDIGALVAVDLADILIGNLPKVEEEIYSLWSDISGIPAEEIKEMEFGTLPLMIADTFSKARNTSFFKVLTKLL